MYWVPIQLVAPHPSITVFIMIYLNYENPNFRVHYRGVNDPHFSNYIGAFTINDFKNKWLMLGLGYSELS